MSNTLSSIPFFVLFKLFVSAKSTKHRILIVTGAVIFALVCKYGNINEYFQILNNSVHQDKLNYQNKTTNPSNSVKLVGEEATYNVFKKLMANYDFDETIIQRNFRPQFLKNPETNRCLEYDMYHPKAKIAIEYNGKQHYEFPNSFHKTEEEFNKQVARDELKKKISKEKGICLISVPENIIKKAKNKELALEEFIQPYVNEWIYNANKQLPGGFDVIFNN